MDKRWTVSGANPTSFQVIDENQYRNEGSCVVCAAQLGLLGRKKYRW